MFDCLSQAGGPLGGCVSHALSWHRLCPTGIKGQRVAAICPSSSMGSVTTEPERYSIVADAGGASVLGGRAPHRTGAEDLGRGVRSPRPGEAQQFPPAGCRHERQQRSGTDHQGNQSWVHVMLNKGQRWRGDYRAARSIAAHGGAPIRRQRGCVRCALGRLRYARKFHAHRNVVRPLRPVARILQQILSCAPAHRNPGNGLRIALRQR